MYPFVRSSVVSQYANFGPFHRVFEMGLCLTEKVVRESKPILRNS